MFFSKKKLGRSRRFRQLAIGMRSFRRRTACPFRAMAVVTILLCSAMCDMGSANDDTASGSLAAVADADGDGVADDDDRCPGTAAGAVVDALGCSQVQVDADLDGVCNADRPMVGGQYPATVAGWCSAGGVDNCKYVVNPLQEDGNSNGIGDACDTGEMWTGSGEWRMRYCGWPVMGWWQRGSEACRGWLVFARRFSPTGSE